MPVIPNAVLKRRLFIFLIVFVIIVTLGSVIVLVTLEAPLVDNKRELKLAVERELSIFSRDCEGRFGDTSVQLVRLSELLSKSMEAALGNKKIAFSD